jgi:hypothetical protein
MTMFCPYLAQRPAVKELIGAESILQLSDLRGDGKLSRCDYFGEMVNGEQVRSSTACPQR